MSIPTQDSQGKTMEDCRDYLRTGRCKYGASCKYNHPENVQNGGGIKPLDPSEPLYPSRPNEPICQYYMKHGTCKFGQACKFDHPPQHAMQFMEQRNGQSNMMNMGHVNEPSVPQLVLNPMGTDSGMILQFLPQRVDEPDCIYFLKNGRCKYGATCRYHHPVQQQQQAATRRVMDNKPRLRPGEIYNGRSTQKVQYVTQIIPNYQGGQHVMASYDNKPVTIVNVDGTNGLPPGYQIISGNDGVTSYCVPPGSVVVTEQGSSASSIASSYETAQEQLNDQWSRARRNSSGGSLISYTHNEARQQRAFIPHSTSEGNIVHRQSRSTSYGSASEMSPTPHSFPRNVSTGSWAPRMQGAHYSSRQEAGSRPPVANGPNVQQRRLVMRRRDGRGGEVPDEGFTMMTSALLNMLDTPEERSADNYSDDEYGQHVPEDYGGQSHIGQGLFEQMSLQDHSTVHEVSPQGDDSRALHSDMFEHESRIHTPFLSANQLSSSSGNHNDVDPAWSPSWLGAVQGPDNPRDGFSMLPRHHNSVPRAASTHDSDVGLYLG